MTSFIESAVADIDNRLGVLTEEAGRLQAARAALMGAGTTPTRRNGNGEVSRGPGRPAGRKAASGNRSEQVLALIKGRPGQTITELANQMGIVPNYLYRVLPKLASQNTVRREGHGWYPVEAPAQPTLPLPA